MSDYFIAIPSYNRCKVVNSKTLKLLNSLGINKNIINIFVVEEEYEMYKTELNQEYYNEIIIGKLGLIQQREFIENYYPVGTHIVSIDDDITKIDLSFTDYKSADEFFKCAFEECKNKNAYLWGVYPVCNPLCLTKNKPITEHLVYIIGALYGYINRPNDSDLDLTICKSIETSNKEDTERSIRYFLKDKKVLRFGRVGIKTQYYGKDGGGLGKLNDRIESMKKSTLLINKTFPELTRIKIRENGLYEIIFKAPKGVTIGLPKQKEISEIEPPIQLEQIQDMEEVSELYNLLEENEIRLIKDGVGRSKTFGSYRSITLGYIKARISKKYDLSYESKKRPKLYQAVVNFGKKICPFEFQAITINKNLKCPKHIDGGNVGKSLLVSLGDYEGCNIVLEGYGEYDTNCRPIIFDGSKIFHYNTDLISGTKYSLNILYQSK
jgi:hypothetical protein